ncbi:MAG: D-alanine--D-alanine ligase [Desulfobacterales bacterium]|nr:D-alanine--D-alanine ligase [Desulfobacterales bacterium]
MKKLSLALISGGISSEREVSLNSGKQVYEALDKDKYDILPYDPKTDLGKLVADADRIDAALIILHGPYGEDGTVQGMLDLLDIPYQGAGVLGSAMAMNKIVSKRLYTLAGLPVLPDVVINRKQAFSVDEIVDHLGLPVVIKPATAGSSIGMTIVKSAADLEGAIEKAFQYDHDVLIEKFMAGTEITGGVLGNENLEALPLIEIIPGDGYEFFDYEAKYKAGATKEICPARIDAELTRRARGFAVDAHIALNCLGYSRTDMMLSGQELYLLETNTIPGMTATSLFPQAANAAGYSFSALLDKLVELSLEVHAKRKSP